MAVDKERLRRAREEILNNKEIRRLVGRLDKLKPDWDHYLEIKEIRDKLFRIGENIWSKHFGQPFGGAAYGEWVIDVVKGRERPLKRYQEMIHRR